MSAEIAAGITDEPLDAGALIDSACRDTCGAVISFISVVRSHNGGKSVDVIEYSSHPSSQQTLRDIVMEFKDRPGVHRIVTWHRVGYLEVGEDAIVVVVAAEHRTQAFHAVEAIVEDMKAKLPVQKKQKLADGSHDWLSL